jgi:hypothetical protein
VDQEAVRDFLMVLIAQRIGLLVWVLLRFLDIRGDDELFSTQHCYDDSFKISRMDLTVALCDDAMDV